MLRQLLERLEAQTKTGVTLRVLPGGKDPQGQTVATPPATPASPAQGMAAVIQGAQQKALPKAEAPKGALLDTTTGIPVGKTFERNGMRFNRYLPYLKVWDLTNAGKRGKTVAAFTLSGLDPHNDKFYAPKSIATMEAALKAIGNAKSYAQAAKIARETADQVTAAEAQTGVYPPTRVAYHEEALRSIEVSPMQGEKGAEIKIETPTFTLEASLSDFTVVEKRRPGPAGDDTRIVSAPYSGAKKTAIKAFYAWVQAHQAEVKRMTFRELSAAMAAADLDYHSFSTMD